MNPFAACCPCFRSCLDCFQGPSFAGSASYSRFSMPADPLIRLDSDKAGKDVVLLKSGERICGTGGAFGNIPVVQNKSYFQVNVQQTGCNKCTFGEKKFGKNHLDERLKFLYGWNSLYSGVWGVGLGNKNANLEVSPVADHFWGVRDTGDVYANGEHIGKLNINIDEGDSLGIAYDHVDLKIFVNGVLAEPTLNGVKGPVYPIVYVDDSAILDVKFKDFSFPAPSGYDEILVEQTLL